MNTPTPKMGIEKAITQAINSLVILAATLSPILLGIEIPEQVQIAIISVAATLAPYLVWKIPNSVKGPN